MSVVYDELHRIAVSYLRRERREHTLQPTALVNELFLKFGAASYELAKSGAEMRGFLQQVREAI